MSDTFKPSDVELHAPALLLDTMGNAEMEQAAALIVRGCQFHGDAWRPLTAGELNEALKSDIAEGREPLASMTRNPFFRPDIHRLMDFGYARMTSGRLELTAKGLEAIRKHVRKEQV